MSTIITEGVWGIYVQAAGGRRLLDGEAPDRAAARRQFHAAIREAEPTTQVELVDPHGEVVDEAPGSAR